MAEHRTTEWSTLLVEVCIAINSEVQCTFRLTTYQIVFNQPMQTEN